MDKIIADNVCIMGPYGRVAYHDALYEDFKAIGQYDKKQKSNYFKDYIDLSGARVVGF